MSKRKMWSFHFTTAQYVLIPVAVGINYVGKTFASILKLPLWLDSIGTILAGMLAGPIIGAISGAVNNILYGLTMDPISFVYALTSIFIGLVAGILSYKGWITNWAKLVVVSLAVGMTAVVISTPLNVIYWGGQTGNVWGDALFAWVVANTKSIWLASFLDEFVVDLPDKFITVFLSYAIYKGLPKNIRQLYEQEDSIERLD